MSDRKQRSDAEPFGARFWDRVAKESGGCWRWAGALMGEGYGAVTYSGRTYSAHRVAYELAIGPIPANRELHHTCGNRWCVNPAHLRAVSRSEHLRLHAGDFCRKGHRLEARGSGRGRECRVCRAERQRANQARRNALQRERRRRARVT